MKTKLFITSFLLISFISVKATDLIVEEFGITPSYPSITAAVAAANDGDRIFIMNRAGNIPWIENITITKSLEFLSYAADTFFVVQGDYIISPAAAGKTISFIGMRNTSGSIYTSGNSPSGNRTKVNILNCLLESGYISFNANNYNVNIASSKLNSGYINFRYGRILGNDIYSSNYYPVTLNYEPTFTGDTTLIYGNKINCAHSSYYGINADCRNNLFKIYNNYIQHRYFGIYITYTSSNNGFVNQIYNNTILATGSSSGYNYGIYAYVQSGSILEIMNNVIKASAGSYKYGIDGSNSGQCNIYYNHIDNGINYPISIAATASFNNNTTASFTINSTTGQLGAGAPGIDGANPSPVFYDLDLTVGDAGAYGGSYTLNNYFPQFLGGARV